MTKKSNKTDVVIIKSKGIIGKKWVEKRMSGKVCFLMSVAYMFVTYLLLLVFPNIVLYMYCVTYPILFIWRIYAYIQSKSFLFLFDNCYFVNTALIVYLWMDLPLNTVFLSIFATVNGPVLWAVLPFRNTLAYHDLDKITSCFIHWAPPLITWSVRWFPHKTSIGFFREFATADINIMPIYKWQSNENWFWSILVPLVFLVAHDILYAIIVHVIIKPNEIYSDSFRYQRSRATFFGKSIRRLPERFQLVSYMFISFTLYVVGIFISLVCYHLFLVHSIILAIQTAIIAWNGGCYYLDYFAYLAMKAQQNQLGAGSLDLKRSDL